jgi:four helix bundle protein
VAFFGFARVFDFRSVLGHVQAKPASPVSAAAALSLDMTCARCGGAGHAALASRVSNMEAFMTLEIYPVVLELVRRLSPCLSVLRTRSASLGDQLERALISIPLNLAEGAYSRGKNRGARYQSAAASAREALACLETAEALGWLKPLDPEVAALFRRVIGTLVRLVAPRR